MRLHRIEIQAFGPFAERQVIDVDALSGSGLFLLHGPTGAGKTSILDAVSFALFGTVPGVRSQGGSLRSHLADPGTPTEVVVEVSFGARRLRLTRRPKQQRQKKRGEGFVEQPPTALAEELVDGEWKAITNRPAEVGLLVSDLLHMGADQFHQVVLLPQGEFARFLRASAEERRPLLEKLFATDRFAKIESWLDEQRKAARHALTDACAKVDQAVHAVQVVASALVGEEALDEIPPAPEHREDLVGWAKQLLELGAHGASRVAQHAARLQATRDELARQHEAARQLDERQRRHADASRRRTELRAAHDEHEHRRAVLHAHEQATPVRPLLTQAERARDTERSALEKLAAQQRAADSLDPTLVAADLEQVRRRHGQLLQELGQLNQLIAVEQALHRRERDLAGKRQELTELQHELDEIASELAELPGRVDQLVRDKQEAAIAAGALTGLRSAASDAEQRCAAGRARDQLRERLVTLDDDLRAAIDAHQDAREVLNHLHEARIANMAAELAAGLVEGSACPVCGSTDHPGPARTAPSDLVSSEQIEHARAAVDAAEQRRSELERAQASLRAKLAAEQAKAGDASVGELEEQAASARAVLARAEERASRLESIETQLRDLAGQERRLREAQSRLNKKIGEITNAITLADQEQNDDRKRLDEALNGAATVADAIQTSSELARTCEALARAIEHADNAARQAREAERVAEREAIAAGFADATTAQRALLSNERVTELREAIRAYDADLAAAETALADPELTAAAAEPPADLDALRAARQQADEQLEAVQRRAGALSQTVETLAGEVANLEHAVASVVPLAARHDEIADLARLVAGEGDNALRMRLSVFVLAARLEQVAHAASQRLHRMSGGRYTLRHTDEEADGRRRGGLGLLVVDAWSGTERQTTTLSGGESFMASLALALGMADVVTAEAGGTRIDTLFIDEGFGSLDDATLQLVMDVLDDLRSGGRTIGIVSHVADLRSRITTQLEVRKGPRGSSTNQVAVAP